MNVSTQKTNLIQRISSLKDENLLNEIQKLIDFELDEGVFVTSESQKIRIQKARQEYQNNDILSNSEANEAIEKWLKRR